MWGSLAKIGISPLQEQNVIWAVFARDGYKGEGSFLCSPSSWRKACAATSSRCHTCQSGNLPLLRWILISICSDEHCLRLELSLGQEKSTKRNKKLPGKRRSTARVSEVQHHKLKEWVFTLCSSKWYMSSPTLFRMRIPEEAYGREKRTGKKREETHMQIEVWLLLNVCVLTLPRVWVKVQSKSAFFKMNYLILTK